MSLVRAKATESIVLYASSWCHASHEVHTTSIESEASDGDDVCMASEVSDRVEFTITVL